MPRHLLALLAAGPLLAACAGTVNYVEPNGPRFVGAPLPSATPRAEGAAPEPIVRTVAYTPAPAGFRIASVNAAFGKRLAGLIRMLQDDPDLAASDVIVLQEMDEVGTTLVANALGLHYVYYPAIRHGITRRNFGNALLSRWPIADDAKLVLPHRSWQRNAQRTAVAGTILVGNRPVRVVALHLGTLVEIGEAGQEDQAEAVLRLAEGHERVVVAGDFNGGAGARVLRREGYDWTTRGLGATHLIFGFDHVLTRGFVPVGRGKVSETLEATDHKPVWTDLAFAEPTILSATAP
jgi:endonuclease/exonuclease/phosphatase family metal-dependent hydrolase